MKLVAIETVKKRFFSDTHRTDSSDIVKHKSSVSLSTLSRYMQVLKVPMWECSYHQSIKITARTYPITKVTKLPADITTISRQHNQCCHQINSCQINSNADVHGYVKLDQPSWREPNLQRSCRGNGNIGHDD